MPNSQIEFTKVKTNFIDPLTRHFGKKLSDEQLEAYVEDLAEFASENLKAAWVHCRRKNKFFPSIYEAIQACEEEKKSYHNRQTSPRAYFAEKQKDFEGVATEVLRSPFGQTALKEGWANSLYVEVKRSGKTDWNDDDAVKFRISLKNAVEAAGEGYSKSQQRSPEEQKRIFGKDIDASLNRALTNLWEAMKMAEKRLFDKFYMGRA